MCPVETVCSCASRQSSSVTTLLLEKWTVQCSCAIRSYTVVLVLHKPCIVERKEGKHALATGCNGGNSIVALAVTGGPAAGRL